MGRLRRRERPQDHALPTLSLSLSLSISLPLSLPLSLVFRPYFLTSIGWYQLENGEKW